MFRRITFTVLASVSREPEGTIAPDLAAFLAVVVPVLGGRDVARAPVVAPLGAGAQLVLDASLAAEGRRARTFEPADAAVVVRVVEHRALPTIATKLASACCPVAVGNLRTIFYLFNSSNLLFEECN